MPRSSHRCTAGILSDALDAFRGEADAVAAAAQCTKQHTKAQSREPCVHCLFQVFAITFGRNSSRSSVKDLLAGMKIGQAARAGAVCWDSPLLDEPKGFILGSLPADCG